MLSPNDKKVLAVLKKGHYFGEFSIYTTTTRISSFISATFSLLYILKKDRLKEILKQFPYADFDFMAYGT